jgi:5-methylcytosine-specific restriction endonuclease McrA
MTCQKCGQWGDTVDHIVPRRLGGGDDFDNLQCLCKNCNYSKGGRFFDGQRTPPTPLVPFFPENNRNVHYEENL